MGGEINGCKDKTKKNGCKKTPFYRIVVADSRAPRDGRFIEELGYYNPLTEPKTVKIDNEKAAKWLKNGAKPTETVERLFKNSGLYDNATEETAEEETAE